ncbi:hypothetical protein ACFX12_045458 [Malus domestica]
MVSSCHPPRCSFFGGSLRTQMNITLKGTQLSSVFQVVQVAERVHNVLRLFHTLGHLNAGDLLEAEAEAGSEYSKIIKDFKKEGRLVPSDFVVKLLKQAMQRSRNKKFLVDGFPRNEENIAAAERIMKFKPDFVLFLDCSEGEMTRRLLNRNQGRVDDNIDTIQKRHQVYFECTVPVVNYYSAKGKVRKIDAERPPEEVFEVVKEAFYELEEKREESMP